LEDLAADLAELVVSGSGTVEWRLRQIAYERV
jgi:hypothetical protein